MPRSALRFLIVATPLAAALVAGCSKAPTGSPDDHASPAATAGAQSLPSGTPYALSDATVQLPAVPGRPAVAYFTLETGPAATGTLISVDVAHFSHAEMHQSKMEGGAMTMSPVASLPITPGKPIVFGPAGLHVMLFDADGALKPGDTADITASLADGTKITAKAKVVSQGGL